jgi:uncharacterized protein (DUF2147 family)|tara:strand:- start:89 stop:541 length:453 start_codon:yes stop_codon:yes gene_type:complete
MRATLLLIISLLAVPSWADNNTDPSGLWNTFDDNGNIESTVEVRIEQGKLYANILSLHNTPEDNPICIACEGDLYGKPVIGMQIINGLTLKNDIWQKGSVFDPKTGDAYKSKVWLENGTLFVRGHIGFLYQTKSWQKVSNDAKQQSQSAL